MQFVGKLMRKLTTMHAPSPPRWPEQHSGSAAEKAQPCTQAEHWRDRLIAEASLAAVDAKSSGDDTAAARADPPGAQGRAA